MADLAKRSIEFERNMDLESFLKEINMDLKKSEEELLKKNIREYPIIFIMGGMRTGTTLMTQWIASTNEFAYPSNMISRFYEVPIIGSKIQKLLMDQKYNFRNEILEFSPEISYDSNNGKTKGALEPNEFWYFWRRFLQDDLRGYSSNELLKKVDIFTFRRELWGMAQVFDKPIALKGMICNYHIPFLNKAFQKAIFICLERNLEKQVVSVLEARKRQFGTYKEWYSFLIPEYEELVKIKDLKSQVKGQIECINNAIIKGIKDVPEQKKIQIKYEDFCKNPENLYCEIQSKLAEQGYNIKREYVGIESFTSR